MSAAWLPVPERLLALAVVLTGCAYASWETANRAPGYRIPSVLPIVVDISDQVARADDHGYTAKLVQTLESELAERHVEAQILTPSPGNADEHFPLPRVEIVIRSWDEGSRVSRYFTGFVGRPSMVVECVVLSAENRPIFTGRLGSTQVLDQGQDPVDTAEIAGRLLARTLAP